MVSFQLSVKKFGILLQNFRNLKVWEKAHLFTLETYKITSNFPKSELYGLSSQIRRAASSIPTNIAEGCGRGSDVDFARFLQIVMGAASEVEYLLILSTDIGITNTEQSKDLIEKIIEIKKMLATLIKKLKADS